MPPFLLGESHGDARMGIPRLLGVCAALLFASSVSAANIIDLGPSSYTSYGSNASHTGAGVRSSFGQTTRLPPSGTSLTVTRNAVIPYGSIANGAKNFLRITPQSVAASAAITGLFLAVDWYWSDELGSWAKDDLQSDPESDIYWYPQAQYLRHYAAPTPEAVCNNVLNAPETGYSNSYEYSGFVFSADGTQGTCELESINTPGHFARVGIRRSGDTCTAPALYVPALGGCYLVQPTPVTDSDFDVIEGELVNQPPQIGADAASDAMRRQGAPLPGYTDLTMTGPSSVSGPDTTSTSTDPVTGDTTVTNTSTQTNISYGNTTITTTNTTTTTTYQNGQETSTTVTTETPGELPVSSGGGAAGDWPAFCDWATVVCDWLNWTQEDPPPEQDLPAVIDDDFFEQKDISFGAKSCPPDHEINLAPFLATTVGVSFQPLCDFAGLIYYMVMAASYIIAAYISIGVARA